MVLCRVRLVAEERVEQRLVGGRYVAGLALQARSHAVIEDGEEVAIVDAVADGNVVLQGDTLVGGRRGRLGWWCALCQGVSRKERWTDASSYGHFMPGTAPLECTYREKLAGSFLEFYSC